MTLDRYADLFDDDLDAVAGRLDAVHTRTAQSNGTETSAASPPAQPTTNNDRRGSTFSCRKRVRIQLPLTRLTVFRWVTPGHWHHIGLTPEEKRSRISSSPET
jgi:hypothetical protein